MGSDDRILWRVAKRVIFVAKGLIWLLGLAVPKLACVIFRNWTWVSSAKPVRGLTQIDRISTAAQAQQRR